MFDRSVRRKAWTMLCLAGLALSGSACSAQNERPTATTRAATEAGADPFAGDWGFSTSCYKGHYVGITLKREGNRYTGTWSDGTDIWGSDGEFKGMQDDDKLKYDVCTVTEQRGGYARCPSYTRGAGYFVRRGEQLVWYLRGGGVRTEYLILDHQPQQQVPVVDQTEVCDE
ncbi:hypothetical protein ASD78_17535 [Lysobacter sp. Root667]|uniref:hypothetical protein n=1 Tax=Lysobacter sp. Root667 TaxID=1736581 RepID=UPI0006FFC407|nr:hypothetical protein [Lysobacter sp. Root667]KRA70646.1 hypothetical protein ASD78_17535 [Lysobacter sp. Root667]